jgi:molecular chaperone DnaK (HSP70)
MSDGGDMSRLGIDFGTYNSSVAFYDGNELVPIKEPNTLNYLVPSSIFVTPHRKIYVGRDADNRRKRNSSQYKNGLKRYLSETTPLIFDTIRLTPIEAIAEVIGKLKRNADSYLKDTGQAALNTVVITIPALYQDYKIDLMRQATVKAGFASKNIDFLKEPVAAGLYYAQKNQGKMQSGEILLVYDLGGGTFDTALLERQGDSFTIYKGTEPAGLPTCGGMNFDHMIYLDLVAQQPEIQKFLDTEQDIEILSSVQASISDACIDLKHQLSVEEEGDISIPIYTTSGFSTTFHYRLTANDFNTMIASHINETISCCHKMLENANLSPAQISRILLVGGSCRIPFIKKRLKQEFQCPIEAEDLELVVCKGAAFYKVEDPPSPTGKPPFSSSPPGEPTSPSSKKKEQGDVFVPLNPWDVLKPKEH